MAIIGRPVPRPIDRCWEPPFVFDLDQPGNHEAIAGCNPQQERRNHLSSIAIAIHNRSGTIAQSGQQSSHQGTRFAGIPFHPYNKENLILSVPD
ncbi:hypothetical protein EJB05_44285, partial [Eragrostis curvula]